MWQELSSSAVLQRGTFLSLVGSGYMNWLGLVLAAAFGTTRTTPMLGDGQAATPWQEGLVAFFLIGGAFVTIAAIALLLIGLGRRPT